MRFISVFILLIFSALLSAGQNRNGWLPIRNFSPSDYGSQAQNWFVKQNPHTGVIYVGNKEGLMEYRGDEWRIYKLHNQNDIKSFYIAGDGIIYVGGTEEFGFYYGDSLKENNRGNAGLRYFCISDLLDSTITHYNDIFQIVKKEDKVYFLFSHYLFIWDGKKIETISSEKLFGKSNPSFRNLLIYNNKIYLIGDEFILAELQGRKVIPIKSAGAKLSRKGESDILKPSLSKSQILLKDGWILNYGKTRGFFKFKIENQKVLVKDFKFESEELVKKHINSSLVQLPDGNLALGFSDYGILITTPYGKIIRHIDIKSGLQNNGVNHMSLDDQGQLWAALGNGVSRIDISSPVEYYKPKISGYTGVVDDIEEFNGRIWLTGVDGLFVSESKNAENNLKFKKVTDSLVNMSCFDLMTFKSGGEECLLVVSYNGIEKIDVKGKITHVADAIAWKMIQDKHDSNRVWVALDVGFGISSLYYTGQKSHGGFVDEGRVPGIKSQCRIIAQDAEGTIWTGSANTGTEVVQLSHPEFKNHKIVNFDLKIYTAKDGLPENNAIFPAPYERKMIFGSGTGILVFNRQKERFEPFEGFGPLFSYKADDTGKQAHRIILDSQGNYWIVSKSKDEKRVEIYLKKPADSLPVLVFQESGKGDIFNTISQGKDGYYWIGGTAHTMRFDPSHQKSSDHMFLPYINEVIAGHDTLFEGLFYDGNQTVTHQIDGRIPIIEYKNNDLKFKYSALLKNNGEPALYSYKLKGFSDEWSPWITRADERFTNLDEGSYEFQVRAKDQMGNISRPVSFRFEVLPPWYRTIWAYIAYFLFFIAFVWGAITVSTRSLKKIIREATAEIQAQKDELEEKNQNILDSIRYAQRIQVAVTPRESEMKKYFPEHFVLWRPRDIVSGDFYWMMHKGNKTILAAADCTGHGVPGAFMSIMGISFLNQIANLPEVKTAADALNMLRHNVITSLNKEGSETDTKDGMDISLCVYDFEEMLMDFSGAYNPLYMIRDGELTVIKADRMPVGVHERMDRPFTNTKFTMKKGDVYYILSDGYIDQFGGPQGKKFMTKRFKQLILEIHQKPMEEQSRILEERLLEWRGEIEQVDDIIIIGVRVV